MRGWCRDVGASAVEYALIVAAVAVILIPVALGLRNVVAEVFQQSCISTAKQNAGGPMTDSEAAAACE